MDHYRITSYNVCYTKLLRTPSYAFIENAWEDVANGMSPSFTFYSATCSEPGSVESKIKQISGEYMIPNSLIIAIPAAQEVHKGDIRITSYNVCYTKLLRIPFINKS